jgi:hypothetical protein
MKSALVSALALLSLVAAAPQGLRNQKRDIKWVTVTKTDWVVVDVVETVYVTAGAPAPQTTPSAAPSVKPNPVPIPAPPKVVPPPPAKTDNPIQAQQEQQPKTIPTPPPASAPAPAPAAPKVVPAPAPAPAPVSPAPASGLANMLPGGTTSTACTAGSPCVGDITYYNPSQGVGACGPKPDGSIYEDTDMVIAVAVGMMGSLSSGSTVNPLCWKKIKVTNPENGKTASGMVVDKCMGCSIGTSIDLSPALYDTLADPGRGRIHNVKWYWE